MGERAFLSLRGQFLTPYDLGQTSLKKGNEVELGEVSEEGFSQRS